MATITKGRTFVSGETVTPAKLNDVVDLATVTNIQTADIADATSTTTGVTNSKLRHSAALSVIGRTSDTAGAPADIAAANDGEVFRRSGTAVGFGTVATAGIADDAVTDAKLSLAANAGEIKKALNADNAPPIYACRAWVNFDGTRNEADTGAATNGANVKIRASGNVASVLKNGTGDFTITFTTAMPDANYAASILVWNTTDGGSNSVSTSVRGPSGAQIRGTQAPSASSITIQTLYGSSAASDGGVIDLSGVHVAVFR